MYSVSRAKLQLLQDVGVDSLIHLQSNNPHSEPIASQIAAW